MIVKCMILVWISSTSYDYVELQGRVLVGKGDYLQVDFQEDMRRKSISSKYQDYVQQVNDNECLYQK